MSASVKGEFSVMLHRVKQQRRHTRTGLSIFTRQYLFLLSLILFSPILSQAFAVVPWDEPLEGPRLIQEWLVAAVPETGNAHIEGIDEDHLKPHIDISEPDYATVENGPSAGTPLSAIPTSTGVWSNVTRSSISTLESSQMRIMSISPLTCSPM